MTSDTTTAAIYKMLAELQRRENSDKTRLECFLQNACGTTEKREQMIKHVWSAFYITGAMTNHEWTKVMSRLIITTSA
jgi:hypothetical protein